MGSLCCSGVVNITSDSQVVATQQGETSALNPLQPPMHDTPSPSESEQIAQPFHHVNHSTVSSLSEGKRYDAEVDLFHLCNLRDLVEASQQLSSLRLDSKMCEWQLPEFRRSVAMAKTPINSSVNLVGSLQNVEQPGGAILADDRAANTFLVQKLF